MNIPFNDLKRAFDKRQVSYEAALVDALCSGYYVLGERLREFESSFARYIGMQYGIGVNSGQDALILAVRALGIGPGDEVIVQANAYIASVLGITENGATPVFVEPDEYFGIDCSRIESAITERTKAILPVHLYGQPCDMERVSQIAKKHGLLVVEDCAQCHGSMQNGVKAGSFSDISCFSFYPTKPLGAFGDGGMCLTNNADLDERLRMLRFYGSREKYVNEIEGVNSRLDELQAACLGVRLRYLDEDNERRQVIARRYRDGISNPSVEIPQIRPGCTHVFHLYPVLCGERDALAHHLAEKGVGTSIHYPIPPHLQKCYARLGYQPGDFPLSEKYADCELSLPVYAEMEDEEVAYVIEAVNSFGAE